VPVLHFNFNLIYGVVIYLVYIFSVYPVHLLLTSRFYREIPHLNIYLIRFGSKYCGGRRPLVSKLSHCKIFWNFIIPNIYYINLTKCRSISFVGSVLLRLELFCMVQHTLSVYLCEVVIDVIKHSFIAKFNNITPIAYSGFLEALCKQVVIWFRNILSIFFYASFQIHNGNVFMFLDSRYNRGYKEKFEVCPSCSSVCGEIKIILGYV
jgi:hypothetical protein